MAPDSREAAVLDAVGERRALVNAALDEHLPAGKPDRLYDAARALLEAGGKRLRPAMSLLVAEALCDIEPLSAPYESFPGLDGEPVDVMAPAVSVEVIHSFTLIHDDIMDDDDMRRGVPAVHKSYDTATAILAGDTLYSKGFEVILDTETPADRTLDAVKLLAKTCTHICEGQAMDVSFETEDDVGPDDYLRMIELKTAVLYAAAAALPGIVLGADRETVDSLYRYGLCVGQAFQIQDDLLDLIASSETLGKRRGSDLVEGKQTIITLHARDNGIDVDDLLETSTDDGGVSEAAIDAAVAELDDSGSIDYAREMAAERIERGKECIADLPNNEVHDLLCDLADFLVERTY